MTEIFKLFMAKPSHAVIVVLCIVTLGNYLDLNVVQKVQAIHTVQQKADDEVRTKVLDMNETLIRIDENVKNMKELQTRFYNVE